MQSFLNRMQKRLQSIFSFLNHDFCPNANRYVYWLKQPIGWFVLAIACSILVALYANPMAWRIAAGLISVVVVGLLFPLIAIRSVVVELKPHQFECSELDQTELVLSVKNRLPIPIWGLFVEGYLSRPLPPVAFGSTDTSRMEQTIEDSGLACVPAFSRADYFLPIAPPFRGRYPSGSVSISCAFPFGIWKARRCIEKVEPLIVRPKTYDIDSDIEWDGKRFSGIGVGRRAGGSSEYLGVRAFRRGDSLKSVHWAQTARTGEIIVCERSQPTEQTVALKLSLVRSIGNAYEARQNLAWRVRIVASLAKMLSGKHTTFQLSIDNAESGIESVSNATLQRSQTLREAMDVLTDLPLDAWFNAKPNSTNSSSNGTTAVELNRLACCITVTSVDQFGEALPPELTRLEYRTSQTSVGVTTISQHSTLIDLKLDISGQLENFLLEASNARNAA